MTYHWAVIGAGPAGIAAVGKLLDHGVPAKEILWIDPHFTVGDFGSLWSNVPGNTKVELFLKFLHASPAFEYQSCPIDFELNHAQKNKSCPLRLVVEPLQWISDRLKEKVTAVQSIAEGLEIKNRAWQITLKKSQLDPETKLEAKNVILAHGANPKNLPFLNPKTTIPLHIAMDATKLKDHVQPHETIAVFGSSHSAMLVLRNLVEMEDGVKHIINFYRSPLAYAVYMNEWILFDDTGLKGSTAEWARNHIDGQLPANLKRLYSSPENIEQHLLKCDKAIYAVGFERRPLPVIGDWERVNYVEQAGIIAPGLFGFGIAFPEAKYNPLGMIEYRVGLWKFMEYIQRIMPIWLNYSL